MMNCFDNRLKMKSDIENAIRDSVLQVRKNKDGSLTIVTDHEKFNETMDCIYAEYVADTEDTSEINDEIFNETIVRAMKWFEKKALFLMGMED